jgi:hypothetical protein
MGIGRLRWIGLVAAVGAVACYAALGFEHWMWLGPVYGFIALSLAFLGWLLVCVAAESAIRGKTPEDALLLVWLGGMLVFVALVNWSTAGRFVLLMLPPLILLVARRGEEGAEAGGQRH